MDLHPNPYFQLFVAGQLDLRSNERSNSNFDCKNGFLGVDYIGFDTLHGKIEHFTQIARMQNLLYKFSIKVIFLQLIYFLMVNIFPST